MNTRTLMSTPLRLFAMLPLCAALTACNSIVLNPAGDIAQQQVVDWPVYCSIGPRGRPHAGARVVAATICGIPLEDAIGAPECRTIRRAPGSPVPSSGGHRRIACRSSTQILRGPRARGRQDWQVQQAEQALRIYFLNFLNRTDWHRQPASPVVDTDGRVDPLTALQLLRARIRTRHYSYRTEASYADWVRRFLDYLAQQHGPRPQVTAAGIRDFLTHLAVHRHVSASTQNQAQCALLFLAREVLALEVDGLSQATRAKRGDRLPVVLSVPDTAALLEALRGTSRLMASLIYGGGLRVSECCHLRFKDLGFDSGLIFVRSGKGDKDRSTLLPEAGPLG